MDLGGLLLEALSALEYGQATARQLGMSSESLVAEAHNEAIQLGLEQ